MGTKSQKYDWLWKQNILQDVLTALTELPNIFDNYEVPYENWNHLDYLFGIDADRLVYDQVLANINRAQTEEVAAGRFQQPNSS